MQTRVLLSIRPRFAEAILSGTKGFEFRRRVFRDRDVDTVVMYASRPVGMVVGEFSVRRVLSLHPDALWAAIQHAPGIDKESFDSYFLGCESGHAIEVGAARRYGALVDLKRDLRINHPPQSFQYLQPAEVHRLPANAHAAYPTGTFAVRNSCAKSGRAIS